MSRYIITPAVYLGNFGCGAAGLGKAADTDEIGEAVDALLLLGAHLRLPLEALL